VAAWKEGSFAVNFDHNQVEAVDENGSGVGVQETTMTCPSICNEVNLIDDSPSSSNNNNNRLSMFLDQVWIFCWYKFCAFLCFQKMDKH
jgi:hypothetical protein